MYTSDTLDIPWFVQESIARVKAEQETTRKQKAKENIRLAAEKSRLAGIIKRQLGHISAELNHVVAQSLTRKNS